VRAWSFCLSLLVVASAGSASTYTVSNTTDSDAYSLRWAIEQANTNAGPDTILFAPALSGQTITVASPLPHVTDDSTDINGDIDGNGKPDVQLSGFLGTDGLVVEGFFCHVSGLAIGGLIHCLTLQHCAWCSVTSCYLGVNLKGTAPVKGTSVALYVPTSKAIVIGGPDPKQRNVIGPGPGPLDCGIRLTGSEGCVVEGNYIGLRASGSQILGSANTGIIVETTSGVPAPYSANAIGYDKPGGGNVFGGLNYGVDVRGVANTQICGNLFGLMANGDTLAPITVTAIGLARGATNTRIGGKTADARNVFAGAAPWAIEIRDAGTANNVIQGNYFGTNRAGTACRPLTEGVWAHAGAGAQTIGGKQPAAGNYFAVSRGAAPGEAIDLAGPASASIQHNVFGLLPAGGAADNMDCAIMLYGAGGKVEDNTIANCIWYGIRASDVGTQVLVYRNSFHSCYYAVALIDPAQGNLGNLGNASTADDGGNVFDDTDDWFIVNDTTSATKAEGNDFGTTLKTEIDERIFDRLDCPEVSRVDYSPLAGGIVPTGGPGLASLTVTGAAALPAHQGADIAFRLSTPAHVTVDLLNLAGRRIASAVRESPMGAGLQRVLWSGRTDSGTTAPPGQYLVQVTARSEAGEQARAVAPLRLDR